ncbi:MAG: phosphoenolpyruvate--protein phosphotransferase, partial [Treponema sp.]|nr:phosphoenolpyruvate--protein phosphotransferase [Treponema sp.]
MNVMLGISAAGGIGIGKVFILPESQELVIPQNKISSEDVAEEWKRFEDAVEDVQEEIESHQKSLGSEDLQRVIFETYQLMLTDPVFTKELKAALEAELYNVEYILQKKTVEYAQKLRSSGNDYLAERSHDIEDVFGKVMNVLLDYHPFNINDVPDGSIIVAKEMKTSDTVILSKRKIAGLALTEGGVASHVAILAKSYGIPAVVGLGNITNLVQNGTMMIVDGTHGEVIDSPDEKTLADYEEKILQEQKYLAERDRIATEYQTTIEGLKAAHDKEIIDLNRLRDTVRVPECVP